MTGTSPFLGAAQFGKNARIYRKKFMNNVEALLEIMEACYEAGGRGIQMIPIGKIGEAAKIMRETHNDFIITGSTAPGPDPMIEELVKADSKIIFAHGMVSDKTDENLTKMIDEITSRGIIPGIAAHSPVSTVQFALNHTDVKTFLIPFNKTGLFMGDQQKLEDLVNSHKECYFVGMKTLSAGKIKAEVAVIPPSPVFDMASDTDADSSITFSDEKPTGSEEKPKADVTLIILEGSATQGNPDYDPKELTVKQGQTILADNVDVVPHTVTSGTGPSDTTSGQIFDTGIIMAGESTVMDTSGIEPGTYDYYCTVHPYMVGKLTIE